MPALLLRPEDSSPLVAVKLEDYRPPNWLAETVHLTVALADSDTRVRAKIAFRRNPERAGEGPADLKLDGRKLKLIGASIDGEPVAPSAMTRDEDSLTVSASALPAESFTWECETEIDPRSNTSLEGLYMSRDMFCTQCEAQGFRKITFFPDRPDVMAVYTTRIEADSMRYPVLLSNGNPVDRGELPGGRHFVEWSDPFPKPSYLFALVAGNLVESPDSFRTRSGREVKLALYTRPGDEDKTAYALDSLKRSMAWDERVYGREYDLDLFMIVAVDDFNMGAMENKGLNIFNSKYVLASPKTATDRDYELIESVVAHEYFHNWTGNRITCRDWFQLCLKEGLTVFRDQQFSADERSEAVVRIDSVKTLRARQFREDAGPLAHPVRPESYVEINNFYTATVYEKGAEVVRMLHTLVGPKTYRAALDLYFERHDGQACTIEDFLKCFEDASGRDLSQFYLWWKQAGTPKVTVETTHDAESGALTLRLSQSTPPTPGQPDKAALMIPVTLGLIGPNGAELDAQAPEGAVKRESGDYVLTLDAATKSFRFEGVASKPLLSLNRGFSAPIILEQKRDDAERAFLLANDADPFNRWEAGRDYSLDTILAVAGDIHGGEAPPRSCDGFVKAMGAALTDEALDPAFRALLLGMPGEDELAGEWVSRAAAGEKRFADPDAIHAARIHVRLRLADTLRADFERLYGEMATPGPYEPSAEAAGKRALKNAALGFLTQLRRPDTLALAERQFEAADNMTDQMPALTSLVHVGAEAGDAALATFFERWKNDSLVLGKWFGVQATSPMEDALERVDKLTRHPAFEWKNPNKFRALIGAFAMANPVNFHRRDGAGYRFFADWLIRLDPVNPQTTAKLVSAFDTWRRYDERRQGLIRDELERIRRVEGLSKDSAEMIDRMLAA